MFFKKTVPEHKLKKSAVVYISQANQQIIVCPRFKHPDGILYEQETCTLRNLPVTNSALGEQVLRNFNLFAIKAKDLRDQKLTDWPAFKCSKMKSVKSFEAAFTRITVSGNNESNIILVIEADLASDKEFRISSSISAAGNAEKIGELVLKVYQKAISI